MKRIPLAQRTAWYRLVVGGLVVSVVFATCVLWEEGRMRVTGKVHEKIVRIAGLSVDEG